VSQRLLLTTILSEGQHGEWSALPFGSHESTLCLPLCSVHHYSYIRFQLEVLVCNRVSPAKVSR
jgi:hypothetical protein